METAAKSRRMLRLVSDGRLKKVLFTYEKIFTVEPLHNRNNYRQLLKNNRKKKKNQRSRPFSGLYYDLSWHLWSSFNETSQSTLPSTNNEFFEAFGTVGVTTQGSGVFGPNDDRYMRRVFSRVLGKGRLTSRFARLESNGLFVWFILKQNILRIRWRTAWIKLRAEYWSQRRQLYFSIWCLDVTYLVA